MEEIAPGTVMDGLQIEAVAGRGGFSVVYRATDLSSGDPVAVKVLSKADSSSRRLLAREAALLAAVDHPGVVPFRGVRHDDNHDVLITDWVAGESLHSRLQRLGPMDVEQTIGVLRALADPLDHLHRLDIVHRDMSPANVIVGPDGTLTIIDLGIGHHVDSSTLTSDDLLAGTPKYLAPEIIRGERADGRADQYSVGVMLHELLTGASPFPIADRVATALHHQLFSPPAPLDEVDPRIPTALAEAVLRSMQKNPEDRFATMADFAAAATRRGPTTSQEASAGPSALSTTRRTAATDHDPPSGRKTGADRRLRVLTVGAAVFVVAAGLALWTTTRSTGDSTVATGTQPQTVTETQRQNGTEGNDRATEADELPLISGETSPPTAQSAPAVPGSDWVAGASAELPCNRLQGTDFANGTVPVDYFGDPPGREQVVTDVGFAGSWALEIGRPGAFGQYGEIIPVQPGETYSFVGWFDRNGEIADSEIGISFLTADYQPLSTGAAADTPQGTGVFAGVTAVPAPADAGFAVPYLFKDGSEGVLIADELIFGIAADCQADIEAAGL